MRLIELFYLLLFYEHPNSPLLCYLANTLIFCSFLLCAFHVSEVSTHFSIFQFPCSITGKHSMSSSHMLNEPDPYSHSHFINDKVEPKVISSRPSIIKPSSSMESLVMGSTNWMFGLHIHAQNTLIRILFNPTETEGKYFKIIECFIMLSNLCFYTFSFLVLLT